MNNRTLEQQARDLRDRRDAADAAAPRNSAASARRRMESRSTSTSRFDEAAPIRSAAEAREQMMRRGNG